MCEGAATTHYYWQIRMLQLPLFLLCVCVVLVDSDDDTSPIALQMQSHCVNVDLEVQNVKIFHGYQRAGQFK